MFLYKKYLRQSSSQSYLDNSQLDEIYQNVKITPENAWETVTKLVTVASKY